MELINDLRCYRPSQVSLFFPQPTPVESVGKRIPLIKLTPTVSGQFGGRQLGGPVWGGWYTEAEQEALGTPVEHAHQCYTMLFKLC